MLHGISSERYNKKEHKKRLEVIQKKLDAQYDQRRKKARIQVKKDLAGPVYERVASRQHKQKEIAAS